MEPWASSGSLLKGDFQDNLRSGKRGGLRRSPAQFRSVMSYRPLPLARKRAVLLTLAKRNRSWSDCPG